jgi:hypothetical protein
MSITSDIRTIKSEVFDLNNQNFVYCNSVFTCIMLGTAFSCVIAAVFSSWLLTTFFNHL